MVELRRDVDLLQEPIRSERRRQFGPQDLERHLTVELQVLGEIDRRHPTTAEFPLDGVAVGEGGLEAGEGVSHKHRGQATSTIAPSLPQPKPEYQRPVGAPSRSRSWRILGAGRHNATRQQKASTSRDRLDSAGH